MSLRAWGGIITLGLAGVWGVSEAIEANQPKQPELYVTDRGLAVYRGPSGEVHEGAINDVDSIGVPAALQEFARERNIRISVGAGRLAIQWTGRDGELDKAGCRAVTINGNGGDPVLKGVTDVGSLEQFGGQPGEFCVSAYTFVKAAADAGNGGVTLNVASQTPTIPAPPHTPTPHP